MDAISPETITAKAAVYFVADRANALKYGSSSGAKKWYFVHEVVEFTKTPSGHNAVKFHPITDTDFEPELRRLLRKLCPAAAPTAAAALAASPPSAPSTNAYEREREENIRRNREALEALRAKKRASSPSPPLRTNSSTVEDDDGGGGGLADVAADVASNPKPSTSSDAARKAADGFIADECPVDEFVAPEWDAWVRSTAAAEVRLLPIRPRSRGARRSLRTFPVVTLHPRFPFNV